jgi:hypothetical protein
MILTEFQAHYPTASLVSELLTIYEGKFVVRVVVQIDGVTRATGMATAQTVEEAEDKARSRAIAIVATDPSLPLKATPKPAVAAVTEPPTPKTIAPEPIEKPTPSQPLSATEPVLGLNYESVAPTPLIELKPAFASNIGSQTKSQRSISSNELAPEDDIFGEFGKIPDSNSHRSEAPVEPPTSDRLPLVAKPEQTKTSEPIDLSEDLAKISVKLKELKWTPEQESEYLERNYGKSSLGQLNTEQVQEFSHYLELFSQSTQITKELKELGWSNQRGRNYLKQTYNKQFRQELNYQQLQDFVEYLQAELDSSRIAK